MLHQQCRHREQPGLPLQLAGGRGLLGLAEDLQKVGTELFEGHGLGLILRIKGQGKAELVKVGDELTHFTGQDMDAQVYGIAAAFAGMDLMEIDDVDIARLRMKCPIFKNAGSLAFHKQQKLHSFVPMGRCIGREVVLVLDPEPGLIQIGQKFVLVTLHKNPPSIKL